MSVRTGRSGKSSRNQKPVRGAAGGLLFLKKIRGKRATHITARPSFEHAARGSRR